MKRKIIIGGGVLLIVMILIFTMNTYQSSPGYTTQEYREEFYKNKPNCVGISILLNKKATWADAPGKSLCIGFLKRK